jgi:hypothetical protein
VSATWAERAKGRVAAGEIQPQGVIFHVVDSGLFCQELIFSGRRRAACGPHRRQPGRLHLFVLARGFPSHPVDGPVPCRSDDPARRARRDACRGPALDRRRKSILDGVLRHLDVPERAREDGYCAAVFLPEHAGNVRLGRSALKSTVTHSSTRPGG